jgi:hypothetical protein
LQKQPLPSPSPPRVNISPKAFPLLAFANFVFIGIGTISNFLLSSIPSLIPLSILLLAIDLFNHFPF